MVKTSTRGFSIIEGVFALFIVFIVLSALSETLSQAASVKKNSKSMGRYTEEFHVVSTLKADAMAAISLASPVNGGSSTNLLLDKVNPRLDFAARTDVIGNPDDPYETTELVTVEYRIDDGMLKRFVTDRATAVVTAERLIPAETFNCEMGSSTPPLLTMTLTIVNPRVTKTRRLKVALKP